jgi:hypothetical protein
MASVPTIPPLITADGFARRLADLFPSGWASTTALTPGGVVYSLLLAFGGELAYELGIPASQMVTLAGTATPGDTVALTITNPNLTKARAFSHEILAGESLADTASALALAISADPDLTAIGVEANAVGAGLTVVYPTVPLGALWTTSPPPSNTTTIAAAVSGSGTELVQIAPAVAQTGSLQYAAAAMRLQTAIGNALDLASLDFFGSGAYAQPRFSGEIDPAFRARLMAALLPTGATRAAVSAAVQRVTGAVPRIVEPWAPQDTGVVDGVWVGNRLFGAIYADVDTAETPGRATNPGERYQAFIDTILPTVPILGGNPLPCVDDGLYADAPGSSVFDFDGAAPLGAQLVYNAINAVKVEGTVVWVRFAPVKKTVTGHNKILTVDDSLYPDIAGSSPDIPVVETVSYSA